MIKPPVPHLETQRLQSLYSLKILDTQAEERFDRITRLATKVFGVSVALVSLVDKNRQWFKSRHGLDVAETPRDISFCGHAILSNEVLIVEDATTDERFLDNPLVTSNPEIRFYAGYPLNAPGNHRIGTLCLIDNKPREFTAEDASILSEMGKMVEEEMFSITIANTDDLTRISNRRGFNSICEHVLSVCKRVSQPALLVLFDLNRFKQINDRFGHSEGDRALELFSRSLIRTFRDSDLIARLGGDEFCVLLTGGDEQALAIALKRLNETLQEAGAKRPVDYELGYSVGTATYDPERHDGPEDLLRAADEQMYADKSRRAQRGPTGG